MTASVTFVLLLFCLMFALFAVFLIGLGHDQKKYDAESEAFWIEHKEFMKNRESMR